jgi:hypothetical protein
MERSEAAHATLALGSGIDAFNPIAGSPTVELRE